ncbi:MAG TPA: CvpA family protein [Myxococcota bacterium]|nr:CvpA family protein [Myxococcota bacterium]
MVVVDVLALAVLAAAFARGLAIGMVREAFSVAALAAACIAVRFGTAPAATWLLANADPDLGPLGARVLAGFGIGLAALVAVGLLGHLVRRSVRFAGLGLADRLAGGAIGAAEGALVVGVALFAAVLLVGRSHPLLADSRVLAAFERAERAARPVPADVAAPPGARAAAKPASKR